MREPLLHTVHRALLTGDLDLLDAVTKDSSWRDIRLVFSLEEGGVPLDLGLGLNASELVVPILKGPRVGFLSADIALQVHGGGEETLAIDHSISFDSNFAEKLRATFAGGRVNQVEFARLVGVLQLKARDRSVQFDLLPFLVENVRLARNNALNDRPLNTIIAFRMIDFLNWDALLGPTPTIEFTEQADLLWAKLKDDATAYLSSLYKDPEILRHEKQILATEALLIRLCRIWHTGGKRRGIGSIFEELVDFSLTDLPALPLTELSIIWSGLHPRPADFFDPIVRDNIRGRPMKLSGMAWDIGHLRMLEKYTRRHSGHFTVAHLATMDAGWRTKLQINPVTRVAIDDGTQAALFIRERELEFQGFINQAIGERDKAELSPDKAEVRRRRVHVTSLGEARAALDDERAKFANALPSFINGPWSALPDV